jgi:predicted nuclease of predicted toxin-antitoxin system
VRLILDMNLSPRWEQVLGAAGMDAVHWSHIGSPTASDAEIMAHATRAGAVVVTQDLDFSAILASTRGSVPSVVVIRLGDSSPDRIGTVVITALREAATELATGALLTIDPRRNRLNLLPLR